MFEESNIVDFFITCFKVFSRYDITVISQTNFLTVVQDALANFTEILPEIPDRVIRKRAEEIVILLKEKLRIAMYDFDMEKEDDFKRILVCNNGCWTIGELAQKVPEIIKPYMVDVIN